MEPPRHPMTLFRNRPLQRESGQDEVTQPWGGLGPVTFGQTLEGGRLCEVRQRLEGSGRCGRRAPSPGGSREHLPART